MLEIINIIGNMTLKNYTAARGAVTAVLAAIIAVSILKDNYAVPVIAFAAAAIIIIALRRRVKEVVYDERDWALAGKSAAYAIQIYSITAVVLMIIFYASRGMNPSFKPIALTLAYTTAFLMLLYATLFKYYSRLKWSRSRVILGVAIAFAAAVIALASIRFLSGEDDWICVDGQWQAHGQPSLPKPDAPCRR